MPLPFEQQPRESNKAFAAFRTYLELGPQRSLEAAARKLAKSLPLLKRWSAKFAWTDRVAAQGAHLALVERGAIEAVARAKGPQWEAREQKLRETEWAMHERAIAAAKRGLDAYMEREKVSANLSDIARMLEIASKLGRLATGLGTNGERRKDGLPTVRIEVNLALEKVYGAPLPGEVVDVEEVRGAKCEVRSGEQRQLPAQTGNPTPQTGEVRGAKCEVSGGSQSLLTSAATKEGA